MSSSTQVGIPSALIASGKRLVCQPGDTIFWAGDATHSVYFVVSGAVRLVRYGRAGEEVILHEARPGAFFAEASLDSAHYHCDAMAGEASELLQFPSGVIRQLLQSDRAFAQEWVALLARQLRSARTRVERLSLKNASERVWHLLYSEGRGARCEVTVQGTLKDLARELGLTHETLYRTLATMARDGLIERQGSTLRLTA